MVERREEEEERKREGECKGGDVSYGEASVLCKAATHVTATCSGIDIYGSGHLC